MKKKNIYTILVILLVLSILSCEDPISSSDDKTTNDIEETDTQGTTNSDDELETPSTTTLAVSSDYTDYSLVVGSDQWYSVSVTSGSSYTVQWLDKWSHSNYTSSNPNVSAYSSLSDGDTYFEDEYFTQTQTITSISDTLFIKVNGHTSSSSGTYAIKVEPSN